MQQRQASAGSRSLAGLTPRVRLHHAAAPVQWRQPSQLGRSLQQQPCRGPAPARAAETTYSRDLSSAPRLIQHKAEAFWFYRFLSIVYDTIVNPGHWTEDMRTDALEPAKLDNPNLKVCCGGGRARLWDAGGRAKQLALRQAIGRRCWSDSGAAGSRSTAP